MHVGKYRTPTVSDSSVYYFLSQLLTKYSACAVTLFVILDILIVHAT